MLTNGSPPKTTNMAPSGGLFGLQQCPDDNVGASDNNARNTPSKDTQFGQPPDQIHPPPGYSYPPSQPPVTPLKLSRFRGHEISLDDDVRWRCNKVHQL
jgi:hypothetical protein